MSYITDAFERLNLQHIREFLLYGVECVDVQDGTYEQRLDAATRPVSEAMKKAFPDEDEYDNVMTIISNNLAVYEEVYFEVGLRCGAKLNTLLSENYGMDTK